MPKKNLQTGFVSYLLIGLIVMMAGIIIGAQLIKTSKTLPSQASGSIADLNDSSVECDGNAAVVHLRMKMPSVNFYTVERHSPTEPRKEVINYKSNNGSASFWDGPGKYAYDDLEVSQGTKYTYVLNVEDKESIQWTVSTPDCTSSKNSCNGTFCIKMREQGCNLKSPYYLLEWTQSPDPKTTHYQLYQDAEPEGPQLEALNNTTWEYSDTSRSHNYYIKAIKSDGSELKTGTITLQNNCF